MTRIHIALLVAFSVCWNSTADAQVELRHKFPNGAKSTTIVDVSAGQTLKIMDRDIVTKSKQRMTVTSVNGKRAADGKLQVSHKIDALTAELNIAGQQLKFDSTNPDAAPPGTSFDAVLKIFKAVSKSVWTSEHDADNRVVAVKGRAKALESLPEELRKLTNKQLEPKYLAQVENDEMAAIPNVSIEKGDTWKLTTITRLEGGQTLKFNKTFKYEGVVQEDGKTLHKINEAIDDVVYDMDAAGPLKFVSSNLKVAKSEGTILFDNQAGKVVFRHSKVRITGPLKFEANEKELPAEVDLTLEQTSKLSK